MDGIERREWLHAGAAERLDRVLAQAWRDLSRSRLQALIRDGRVTLDGAPARDPGQRIAPGSRARLDLPPAAPAEPAGETMALAVVHEDVGDVRAGSVKRVASAVGEGSVVVSAVHSYLAP